MIKFVCMQGVENKRQIRVLKLSEQDNDNDSDLKQTTPQERWAMMWQLAQDAWAFRGESRAESRLPRHIVRVLRRES